MSTAAPLPELAGTHVLPAEAAAAFARDGHVLVHGLARPDELAPFRAAIRDCVFRAGKHNVPLADRDTYHKAFLQIANLWETDPVVAEFTQAKRFARVAAQLMDVDGVRLYHDQALFKEPRGGHTPWHQDQYYWPLASDKCVTMWMPLVDVPVEMGVLTFASGSHRAGDLLSLAISDESEAALDKLVRDRKFPIVREAMFAGDATFHAGWTIHTAPPNQTDTMREVMTVIYVADGMHISAPDNPHRPADLARWFPGQKPGDVVGSPLNPLLYHKTMDP
jgi:ectoine hydroxylase-related dioxygenase (phytanoyl-CoA dioxygenase family)